MLKWCSKDIQDVCTLKRVGQKKKKKKKENLN